MRLPVLLATFPVSQVKRQPGSLPLLYWQALNRDCVPRMKIRRAGAGRGFFLSTAIAFLFADLSLLDTRQAKPFTLLKESINILL